MIPRVSHCFCQDRRRIADLRLSQEPHGPCQKHPPSLRNGENTEVRNYVRRAYLVLLRLLDVAICSPVPVSAIRSSVPRGHLSFRGVKTSFQVEPTYPWKVELIWVTAAAVFATWNEGAREIFQEMVVLSVHALKVLNGMDKGQTLSERSATEQRR